MNICKDLCINFMHKNMHYFGKGTKLGKGQGKTMGLADISIGELVSSATRSKIGKRIFKSGLQSAQKDDKGGIIGWLWNGAKQLGGFLLSEAGKFLSWSFA